MASYLPSHLECIELNRWQGHRVLRYTCFSTEERRLTINDIVPVRKAEGNRILKYYKPSMFFKGAPFNCGDVIEIDLYRDRVSPQDMARVSHRTRWEFLVGGFATDNLVKAPYLFPYRREEQDCRFITFRDGHTAPGIEDQELFGEGVGLAGAYMMSDGPLAAALIVDIYDHETNRRVLLNHQIKLEPDQVNVEDIANREATCQIAAQLDRGQGFDWKFINANEGNIHPFTVCLIGDRQNFYPTQMDNINFKSVSLENNITEDNAEELGVAHRVDTDGFSVIGAVLTKDVQENDYGTKHARIMVRRGEEEPAQIGTIAFTNSTTGSHMNDGVLPYACRYDDLLYITCEGTGSETTGNFSITFATDYK